RNDIVHPGSSAVNLRTVDVPRRLRGHVTKLNVAPNPFRLALPGRAETAPAGHADDADVPGAKLHRREALDPLAVEQDLTQPAIHATEQALGREANQVGTDRQGDRLIGHAAQHELLPRAPATATGTA